MASPFALGLASCALQVLVTPAREAVSTAVSISSWTVEEGLPQNSVSGIAQDDEGYLWIATYGGLARFDGRHFELFNVGNRPDLEGSRFNCVLAGRDGLLWVVVQAVGLLRYDGERFALIESSDAITQLTEDARGRVWAVSEGALGRVDGDRVLPVREGALRTVLPADDGSLWLSTSAGTIVHLTDDGELELGEEDGLPGRSFPTIALDAGGRLWAASKWGTWRCTDATNTAFEEVEDGPKLALTTARGPKDELWFGCQDRLVRWDPDLDSFKEIARGSFTSLLATRRGNLWTGSVKGGGLWCIRPSPLRDITREVGLSPGDTWGITAGGDGSALVVQTNQVVQLLRDGELIRHEFERNTRCALIDRRGDLWIGQSHGLIRIRGAERTEYLDVPALWGGIRALHEAADGALWIGSANGLSRRLGEELEQVHGDELVNIRCLLEDRGRMWVGTQRGLACLESGSIRWLTALDGLSPGSVRTLHLDRDGVLWVGTYGGGLSRVEGQRITRYSRENGLADDFLASILEDEQGRLWINSNQGPFVVHRAELDSLARGEIGRVACVLFSHVEGAREANGGNQPSGWRAPDGRMWFPSIEGVTVADPAELPESEEPPRPRIELLELDEDRQLKARFTALGFTAPERVRVQYRLDGHDSAWIDCDGPREAHYSYLRPGDYEFLVRARNGFGAWSEVARRPVAVAAAFHESPAFLAGVLIALGLGTYAFVELRLRAALERAEQLELLIAERERAERALNRSQAELSRLTRGLLVAQESERRRISSELHDDVTQRIAALAIQAEIVEARLDAGPERARAQLNEIIEKTQQLAGDVQQLSRRLHPIGLKTLGLSEAVRQESGAFTRRSGVDVELAEDVPSDEVPEDVALAVFRIFQESLHNIEKHAHASAVSVAIEIEAGELVLTVRDRGRGFDSARGAEAGLGLITMHERAAAVGGRLSIASRPGEGTEVRLHAPVPRIRA